MKVYVNGEIFEPEKDVIAIILTEEDKKNIRGMKTEKAYLAFPDFLPEPEREVLYIAIDSLEG